VHGIPSSNDTDHTACEELRVFRMVDSSSKGPMEEEVLGRWRGEGVVQNGWTAVRVCVCVRERERERERERPLRLRSQTTRPLQQRLTVPV
jgi:hypothetical protein